MSTLKKETIENWIKDNPRLSGYGSGFGGGCGYDAGTGHGSGFGDGYGTGRGYSNDSGEGKGYGVGCGYGNGSGEGRGNNTSDGFGLGSGSGSGSGSDSCFGSGDGYGNSKNITKYQDYEIFRIDATPTIITNIRGKVAKGFLLLKDFTLKPCYVVKGLGYFAHGNTLKEAYISLQEKINDSLPHEEKINRFKSEFNKADSYSGHKFFMWHHIMTGSCLIGRNNFVEANQIDLDKKYMVNEFLEIVKDSYGWEDLKELVEEYK